MKSSKKLDILKGLLAETERMRSSAKSFNNNILKPNDIQTFCDGYRSAIDMIALKIAEMMDEEEKELGIESNKSNVEIQLQQNAKHLWKTNF